MRPSCGASPTGDYRSIAVDYVSRSSRVDGQPVERRVRPALREQTPARSRRFGRRLDAAGAADIPRRREAVAQMVRRMRVMPMIARRRMTATLA